MSKMLIVPAEMVEYLRSGVHIELGAVTQDISEASDGYERQAHPEWFSESFSRFDATRGLLEVVGWSTSEGDQDVEVDLDAHRVELLVALTSQLEVERNIKQELDREHADRTVRQEATQRVLELGGFVAAVKARLSVP